MLSDANNTVVDRFIQFYKQYYHDEIGQLAQGYPNDQKSLFIDYDDLYQFDTDLAEDFKDSPDEMQEYAEEALQLYDLPVPVELDDAHVRIENIDNVIDIRNIRVEDEHRGSLIGVKGVVRKATDVRPKITEAAFECGRCGTMNPISQTDNEISEPHECIGCEREGPFNINFDNSSFVDAQKLQIQESPEGLRGGETPKSIDVNIEDDITGEVTPGDHVTVIGVLHIERVSDEDSTLFENYIDGVSVAIEDVEFEDMEITEADIDTITELSNKPDIFDRMINSLAPSIYGYEEEKLAMIFQLFSGVTKNLPDGSHIRGDLHMLLIGDPGTGKSQLLSYIEEIAPRSVYTSGKGSSSAGLTAAAVQDDFGEGQQWTLEAGALPMADKGIAAIDELDKMDSGDRSAMHEALEQQKISIAKAGINATLKSRCSLLGAANPKYGRFDNYEPIGEQIDLEPALISRFDLIFTVTDKPDPDRDTELADHILTTNLAGEMNTQYVETTNSVHTQQDVDDMTDEVAPEIDSELLRKYIAHSQRSCYPTMTGEAKEAIQEFYVDLRSKGADEDAPIPVTARKLEALVRLAEASARVRLSDTVDQQDAEKSIEIVRSCLDDIGIDPETGNFDADVVETGQSKTQRDRMKSLLTIVSELEEKEEHEDGAPREKVIERAQENGMDEEKAENEVEKLRRNGKLYEPNQGNLRAT